MKFLIEFKNVNNCQWTDPTVIKAGDLIQSNNNNFEITWYYTVNFILNKYLL